jgi:hypothetical protein
VRVSDLKDRYEGRVFLYCDVCGAEYSAHRGDYFMLPDDHVFTCDHGATEVDTLDYRPSDEVPPDPPTPLRLVRKLSRLEDVGT